MQEIYMVNNPNQEVEFLDLDGQLGDIEISIDEANDILDNINVGPSKYINSPDDEEEETRENDTPDDVDDEIDKKDDTSIGDEDNEDDEDDDEQKDSLGEEDDEDNLKGYDPKVQKRIRREIKNRREAEDRIVALTEEYESKIRMQEQQAAIIAKVAYESLVKSSDRDLEDAKQKLIDAKESGDTKAEVEAQIDVNKLYASREILIQNKNAIEQSQLSVVKQSDGVNKQSSDDKPKNQQHGITQEGRKWIQKNSEWIYGDSPLYTKALEKAQEIDNSGTINHNPNTPEYFDELNRRLKSYFPQLSVKPSRERVKRDKKGITEKASPVAGKGLVSANKTTGDGKNKVRLDKSDYDMMRAMGYDPKTVSPAFLKEWAINKRSML